MPRDRGIDDGRHIVFGKLSLLTGQLVITIMRADGTDVVSLTNSFELGNYGGIYTPDGKQIGFGSSIGGLVTAAWIMDADGHNQKRLTGPGIEAGAVSDFSPDGERLAFYSDNTGNLPNAIYTMNLDGSGLKQLTHSLFGHDLQPSFSPDGNRIVFVSDRFNANSSLDLFVMNTNGSDAVRIATGLTRGGCPDFNCVGPSWGPNLTTKQPSQSATPPPSARTPPSTLPRRGRRFHAAVSSNNTEDMLPDTLDGSAIGCLRGCSGSGYCTLDGNNKLTGTCLGPTIGGLPMCASKSQPVQYPAGKQAIAPTNFSCSVGLVTRVDGGRRCTD